MSDATDTVVVPHRDYDIAMRSRNLLNSLLSNPKHAPALEAMVAEENPEAKFPKRAEREAMYAPIRSELEAEREARKALEARLQAREEAEAAAERKSQENALLDKMNSIRAKRGFSDETMDRVVARMREQNNPDIDAAAAWVSETLPKPAPAVGYDYLPSTVDVFGSATADKAWEGLHRDPDRWQTDELRAIVRDPEFLRLGNAA
jgi:hypothetical protein